MTSTTTPARIRPNVECSECDRTLVATTSEPYAARDRNGRPTRYWYVRRHNRPDGTRCAGDHSAPIVRLTAGVGVDAR